MIAISIVYFTVILVLGTNDVTKINSMIHIPYIFMKGIYLYSHIEIRNIKNGLNFDIFML